MATLVMFSGGLDSTAMLVKLLGETRDELRVHHIRMANRERRDDAEQRAVEAIVAWCRDRYRPFRYSESGLDFADLEAIPIDYLSIAFVACQVAIDTPRCDRIAVAALARDTDIENRSARQRRVFDALYDCYRARKLGEPEVEVDKYLTDTDSWYVQTDVPNGLMSYWRREVSLSKDNEFDTDNAKAKATMRFSAGAGDWRSTFGNAGA